MEARELLMETEERVEEKGEREEKRIGWAGEREEEEEGNGVGVW